MNDMTQSKHAATAPASRTVARAANPFLLSFRQAADLVLTCIMIGFGLGIGGFLAYWLVRGLWLLQHGHM
jgi:hypothetical protein